MDDKNLIPPGLKYLADNVKIRGNILGVSKAEAAGWARGLDLPANAETVFFAGCGYQFGDKLESLLGLIRRLDKSIVGSQKALEMANFQRRLGFDAAGTFLKLAVRGADTESGPLVDAVKVLRRLGGNPGYMAENEPCCGAILHYAGLQQDFIEHAGRVHEQFKSKGVRRIISIVPSCTYTLSKLIPQVTPGYDLQVQHFCEVVAENVGSLHLRFPRPVKVTYHDPCQLVRYLSLVDEPRRILRAIKDMELVEPPWTSCEMATCCGGGGGFEAVFPELSEILAANRAQELLATGAEIIVTHCPGCIMQLKAGLKTIKADSVPVLDLAQVVARAMED